MLTNQETTSDKYPFLSGGGEMGRLMRSKDWSQTSLGMPGTWPQSLRTTLALLLHSKFPMFLWWGPELTCFYNDAYRPSLGQNGKHPSILGAPAKEAWTEIWDIIYPLIKQVLDGGEATWSENQLIPIYRNGKLEDVYWTFSYSPVQDESGKVSGVFVTCSETTDKILSFKRVEESRDELQFAIDAADLATWDINPLTNKFTSDERLREWHGLPPGVEFDLETGYKRVHENDKTRLQQAIQAALDPATGGRLDIEYSIRNPFTGQERVVRAKGKTIFNEKNEATSLNGILQDVTEQVMARRKVEESEERFRSMAESSDILIAISDVSGNAIFFNQAWSKLTGRPVEELKKFGWADLIHEEDKSFTDVYLDAFEKRIPWTAQYRILNKDGGYSWLLGQGQPRFTPDGIFAGFIGSCIDHTQQVKATQALQDSEKRFRNIMEQTPLGITILRGRDHIVEMANEIYLELINKKKENFVGRPLFETLPEVKVAVAPILKNVLETGQPYYGIEFPVFINKTGIEELTYFNFVYHPLKEEEGGIQDIIVVASDVTASVKAKQTLQESEQQFRNMVMQSPIAMTIFRGEKFVIEIANKELIDNIWRRKAAEVIGKPVTEVFPELKDQKYEALLNKVYQTGITHRENEAIAWIQGDDGMRKFYLDFEYRALYDTENLVSGIIITVNDVTEKVEARLKLEQNEQRLNLVLDASELGTWEWNIQTDEVKYSDRFVKIFGFEEASQITHEQFLKRLHPDDLAVRAEAFKLAYKTGILHYETRIVWSNGIQRWMDVKGKVFKNNHGEPIFLIGTARDTTDERYHQKELEDRERRFRQLADAMPQMVWTANAYGDVHYFNQSVYSYSGLSEDEMIANGWLSIVHPEDQEDNLKAWKLAIDTGTDYIFEHRFRRADGEYRWQLSRAIPQKDELDNIRMWVGTSTDIQQIKELDEQKDLFIGMASHELKTPVTTVKGYVQLLQDMYKDREDDFLKHSLDRMHKQIITLTDLISDLLDLSKIKSGSLYFNKENFDISELAAEIVHNTMDVNPGYNIEFEKPAAIMVHADRNRLAQVLINFLTNAIKYSPDSKLIKVVVDKHPDTVTISVEDHGIGIVKGDQEKIFERFYRVEGKNEKTFPGFGIGLFISAEIIKKHAGNIGVTSEQSVGSTFYFTVPLLHL